MFKTLFQDIQAPEDTPIFWGLPLFFGMSVSYLIAIVALGLLPITTLREDDLQNPDATSIFAASIIGSIVMLWVITRNIWSAIIDEREAAKNKGSKNRQAAESLSVLSLLRIEESRTRPVWTLWLMGLAAIIALDSLALILGRGSTLPLGLDRLGDAGALAWLLAALLLVVLRPITEQVIFQGILYPVVVKLVDDNMFAVMITAVAFALFYLVQTLGADNRWALSYWGLFFPFVLGLSAGVARAVTKSTIGAIGVQGLSGIFLWLSAAVIHLG